MQESGLTERIHFICILTIVSQGPVFFPPEPPQGALSSDNCSTEGLMAENPWFPGVSGDIHPQLSLDDALLLGINAVINIICISLCKDLRRVKAPGKKWQEQEDL